MPTYEYETPHGILDIEAKDEAESIQKLTASLKSLDYQAKAKAAGEGRGAKSESTWEYIKDAVAGQFADITGKISAGRAPGVAGLVQMGAGPGLSEQEWAAQAAEATNYQGLSPADSIQAMAGGAAKAVTHPLSYMGPGGVPLKVATALFSGAGAEGAGEVARSMGAERGGGLDITAQLAGGIATGAPVAGLGKTVVGAWKAGKNALSSRGSEAAVKALEAETSEKVKAILQQAMKADPELKKNVAEALVESARAGVDSPVTALIDNPVIQARLNHLATVDKEFYGQYYRQLEEAKTQLQSAKNQLFGSAARGAEVVSDFAAKTPQQLAEETAAQQAARINRPIISEAQQKTAQAFPAAQREADMVRRLERVTNEDLAISPTASKAYDDIAKAASEDGAALSSQSAAELRAVAEDMTQNNPFHRFPSLIEKIKSVVKPQRDGGFEAIDYNGARDLQQELNRLLRTSREPADQHYLGIMKQRLETMMYEDMPQHAQRLRDANMRYAYDANLLDFTLSAVDSKTGILNPEKAAEWIANNKGALKNIIAHDEVLGKLDLNKAISDPSIDIAKVLAKQVKAENIVGKIKVEDFFKGRDPNAISRLLMNDPGWGREAIKRFAKDADAMKAMRAFMLDYLTADKGKSFDELFNTPTAVRNLNQLFGPGYVQTVKKLGNISDKLAKAATHKGVTTPQAAAPGIIEKFTGIPASMWFSKLRNPIISLQQAVFELASKGATVKQAEMLDRQLKEVLIDPKRFATLVRGLENIEPDNIEGMQKVLQKVIGYGKNFAASTGDIAIRSALPAVGPALEGQQ